MTAAIQLIESIRAELAEMSQRLLTHPYVDDVEQGRLVTSIATVQYLAWAIPAIGFLGTVRGLAGGLSMAASSEESTAKFLDEATKHLTVAFDCTFVALALSLVVMYFLHTIQRDEESLVLDCQQYCQEHLVLRLYDPEPEHASA